MNRPVNFNDPTGHYECNNIYGCTGPTDDSDVDVVGGGGNNDDEPHGQGIHIDHPAPTTPETWLESVQPKTYIESVGIKLVQRQKACYNGNLAQGPSASEYVRGFCGKFDPVIVNPELGGTNLSYGQLVMGVAEYLGPTNPLSRLAPAIPGVCLAYNCAYDVITNTGEHSNLRDISVTPQSVGYTVVAAPVVVPAAIQSWDLLVAIFWAIVVIPGPP